MFTFNWLPTKKAAPKPRKTGQSRSRKAFAATNLPVISPRRGRRILRREQLFSVVRESMIRGGVLSTSYEFKVLTLDATGDTFLVLIDLALPAQSMPDEYLMEIERWIQDSANSRHTMTVRSVYWRRKSVHDQRGIALKAAVAAQTGRYPPPLRPGPVAAQKPPILRTAVDLVDTEELEAFRRALRQAPPTAGVSDAASELLPVPESHSDFSALSETQHGKL